MTLKLAYVLRIYLKNLKAEKRNERPRFKNPVTHVMGWPPAVVIVVRYVNSGVHLQDLLRR